jgi:hypothetical protein
LSSAPRGRLPVCVVKMCSVLLRIRFLRFKFLLGR